jgi:hypothetical protein
METLLVRLKPYAPRRGNVLKCFTYAGIKFQSEQGWYRVETAVADYLRTVHQQPDDSLSALAFDVCTDAEAKTIEATEADELKVRKSATDDIKLAPARPSTTVTTEDASKAASSADERPLRPRKDKE